MRCGAVDIGIGFRHSGHGDVNLLVDRPVGIVEAVGEEPLVGFFEVENLGKGAVALSGQLGEAQAGGVAAGLHGIDDFLGLGERDGLVGGAVHDPERHLAERAVVGEVAATAEGHGSGHLLRIGCHEMDGAVAAKTHS